MGAKLMFAVAFGFLLLGAILSFALHDSNTSISIFEVRSLGFVFLFTGAVLTVGGAIATVDLTPGGNRPEDPRTSSSVSTENLRAITGLVAVVAALIAVGSLTIVAITVLDIEENKDSIVAVTTSAFGIVSAVVTAFLGIKASANAGGRADEKTEQASDAEARAEVAQEKHDALLAALDAKLPEAEANAVKAEALDQKSTPDPPNPPTAGE